MPKFSVLSAASGGAGFQYYSSQTYSFTKAGVFLPKVSGGVYHHDISTYQIAKPSGAGTKLVLTNLLMNVSVTDAAGIYYMSNGSRQKTIITGSAGGFPIYYIWSTYTYANSNNLNIALDVGNGSAVNDVTTPAITISGTVFFYVAPF